MSANSKALRVSGTLLEGVKVGDEVHRDFVLRPPTVQDNMDAVDEVGSHNTVAVSAAILTRQIVKLGTLKPEEITLELIAGLHPSDFNLIEQKADELEKKRRAAVQAATAGTESGSASSAQD